MKRLFTVLLMVLLIFSLLCACGGKDKNQGDNIDINPTGDVGETADPGIEEGPFAYGNGKDYIANNLGDFSIVYKCVASGGGEFSEYEIKGARTAEGYFVSIGGLEQLYIKNGNTYDEYLNFGSGFEKLGTATAEEAENSFSIVFDFLVAYKNDTDNMQKVGTETIAGRNCDKYAYKVSGMEISTQWTYCIDKETGVCLKWDVDLSTMEGFVGITFECTEFKTSGAVLPTL